MSEKKMIKITEELALLLHEILTRETGGDPNIRDESLLLSALESAFVSFDGKDLYPTLEEKAARLGYALISNHAFVDGNKRIGMLVMMTFLSANGKAIHPKVSEVVRVGLGVACGELKYDDILSWILENEVKK